jgi:metal-responsive CopG/Arc/MetJ family transcriptional regulator
MKQRIAFELSTNLYTKFQKIAKDRETTLSNLLRETVRNFVNEQEELEATRQKAAQETPKPKTKAQTKAETSDWMEQQNLEWLKTQRPIEDSHAFDRPIKPTAPAPKQIDNLLKSWDE